MANAPKTGSDGKSLRGTKRPAGARLASDAAHPAGRFYFPLHAKFAAACLVASAWTLLSVGLSMPWMRDLSAVTGFAVAVTIITFVAYVPGFMNAFLLSTLLFDRKPPRRSPTSYPGTTILVAAYNEAAAIRDTLTSLARQD